jgi:GAF domain-containing protein
MTVDDELLLPAASASQLLAVAANALVRQGADMATSQVLARKDKTLLLVGHVGFDAAFVEHFAVIDDPSSTSCGRASHDGRFVEVPDVADDPIFNGTENQAVILDAGSRSTASFPVCDGDGDVVGVVSTHYRSPGRRSPEPALAVVRALEGRLRDSDPGIDDEYEARALEIAHLRRALASRDLIGMAKGIVMSASGVDENRAFRVLVRASQRENVKLQEICGRIVADHEQRARHRRGAPGPAHN